MVLNQASFRGSFRSRKVPEILVLFQYLYKRLKNRKNAVFLDKNDKFSLFLPIL